MPRSSSYAMPAGPRSAAGPRRRLVRRTVLSPRSLTSVAVVLAGQKRSMVSVEWQGHLLGSLTQRQEISAAAASYWPPYVIGYRTPPTRRGARLIRSQVAGAIQPL